MTAKMRHISGFSQRIKRKLLPVKACRVATLLVSLIAAKTKRRVRE